MVEQQRKYKTKQGEAVSAYLTERPDSYLSVDEVWSALVAAGDRVGRSTVYRKLESMAQEGSALKATAPGGEARYRIAVGQSSGQLVCLSCGRAFPLDCHMVQDFSAHVREHHGFQIDAARTVLYGLCEDCKELEA